MLINKIKNFDFSLILVVLLLSFFGIVIIYSASYSFAHMHYDNSTYFFTKQLQWFVLGIILFIVAAIFPIHVLGKLSPLFVFASIFLLIVVLIPGIGIERNSSQRWIQLGSFLFQPSEAVKLFMLIYFAYIFAKKQSYIDNFNKGVLPPLLILLLVFLLILNQPDLGTAALILLSCGLIVTCSGVKKTHLILLGTIAIVGISYFAYTSPYRLTRLTSFLHPFEDASGDGYQLVNSYMAIATGGLWGNGLGGSVQKLGYLPEAHTDFIMAIVLEEIGIIGLAIIITSYVFIMFRGVRIAIKSNEIFPKLLALGLTFQIMTQAVFNLGAVSGLLPITGITLPFVSYGGSSLVFMMISAGILINLSSKAST